MQVLKKDGRRPQDDIFLDFENAQPTDEEKPVFDEIKVVLDQSTAVLSDLREYTGAGDAIRMAIENPGDEAAQKGAWDAVCPLVQKLKNFYDFSGQLESVLPVLLKSLCEGDPVESLERKQALAKQFAEILHFVLLFDELKMGIPNIQNDFSYYRRTLSRIKMNQAEAVESIITNEEANRMSLFYAYPTPILKVISDATTKFVAESNEIPLEHTTNCLSTMAEICRVMIEQPDIATKFHNPGSTISFCQKVMVGLIILYDHVHPIGAFSKKNPAIDVRGCIRLLQADKHEDIDNLLSALKYTTKHLNEDSTPKDIKKLLNV